MNAALVPIYAIGPAHNGSVRMAVSKLTDSGRWEQIKWFGAHENDNATKNYQAAKAWIDTTYSDAQLYTDFPFDQGYKPMRELNEYQKQTLDQQFAYADMFYKDNWGLPVADRRRRFEQFTTTAHYEQIGYIPLPDSETVVAYYSQRYDFPYIPPKLSQAELDKRQAQQMADDKARYKAQDRQHSKDHAKSLQSEASKHGFVEMTFGGSHRSIKKVKDAIVAQGIRTGGTDMPVGLHNWKRRSIDVHKDDVEKARKIGMSIRKG